MYSFLTPTTSSRGRKSGGSTPSAVLYTSVLPLISNRRGSSGNPGPWPRFSQFAMLTEGVTKLEVNNPRGLLQTQ
jgi:hypothetical protein